MKYINSAIILIAIVIVSSMTVFSQETQTVVVDEVVAQVNESVITLSQVKREDKRSRSRVSSSKAKPPKKRKKPSPRKKAN